MVVLTDGIDTASRLTPAEVSGKAAAIDVPVYVIAVVLPIDNPCRRHREPAARRPRSIGTIEDLARWTGGARITAARGSAQRGGAAMIDELRQQYMIAFEPGAKPAGIRSRFA